MSKEGQQCPCGRTDAHGHKSDEVLDRTGWKAGPWNGEPDYIHWVDEQTDLDCLVVRAKGAGHLCGYVGVPEDHPWHGLGYQEVYSYDSAVHGGLTYSDHCKGRICHHVAGRPEPVWWLGFDCGHSCDHSPGEETWFKREVARTRLRSGELLGNASLLNDGGTYRNVQYVKDECRTLCNVVFKAAKAVEGSEL